MKKWIAVMFTVVATAGGTSAYAQDVHQAPGTVVLTIIPGGATIFTEGKDTKAPSFVNYGLGAAAEVRINRFVGVEGEITGALGVTQNLDFTSGTQNLKTPSLLNYNGNVVVTLPTGHSVAPYVTGGVGGITVFDKASLNIPNTESFFTGNVGGGAKWFSSNGRWGLRGDYRFIAVKSKDTAPTFFGAETRYGHRLYGGLLINVGR
jgi:hypothetical protein